MPATKQLHIKPALHERLKKKAKASKVTLGELTEIMAKGFLKPTPKSSKP